MKNVILVFEITTDSFWMKDVVQFPSAIANRFKGEAYIITRRNNQQSELRKHISLSYLGNDSNNRFSADLSSIKISHWWYLWACMKAAGLGEILVLYPFFGNPILGSIIFRLSRLLKLKKARVVIKTDGFLQFLANRKSLLLKTLANLNFPFFNQIICENDTIYKMVLGDYPNLSKKLVYIPNCPISLYHNIENNTPFSERPKNFLFVGRVSDKEKGGDILLNNWLLVAKKLPEWKLFLVGACSIDFKREWEKKLSDDDLSNSVVWINGLPPDKLKEQYNHSRIVICSSRKESGPIVLGEAGLSGCAFIGTNVGEIPFILNELPGLVNNVEHLADTMLLFAKDALLAEQQAEELYKRVKDRNWKEQVEKII